MKIKDILECDGGDGACVDPQVQQGFEQLDNLDKQEHNKIAFYPSYMNLTKRNLKLKKRRRAKRSKNVLT